MAQIKITWRADGRGYKDAGMVEDKSSGGLGIRFPVAVPVGSVVALAQGSSTNFAVVRHCTKLKGQFFIGVEFCELPEGAKPTLSSTAQPQDPDGGRERRKDPRVKVDEPLPPAASRPAPAFHTDLIMEKRPQVR